MNDAEKIAAAIEKLEEQRAGAFPGPWTASHSGVANGDHSYVVAEGEWIAWITANDGIDEEYRAPTADLIVTLHRSIPALLGLLRVAVNNPGCETDEEVALAKAILGDSA